MSVRLTQLAKRAGCAAKQPQGFLLPLLSSLPALVDPNVIVGNRTADDAAIYRLGPELALVLTTDFFTPIVDEPRDFGAIAAANALSDVYAMGGRPIAALAIVGFPDAELGPEVLADILRGGAEKAQEAGIDVVGGHTIKSDEPLYGLAVVGTIHPDRVVTNAGARPGDVLVLTKPLGSGIITTAAKQGRDVANLLPRAISVMTVLNASASEAMLVANAHAATDVTGFGLLGHLRNVLAASGCSATVRASCVPMLEGAHRYAAEGIVPGGTRANLRFAAESVTFDATIEDATRFLLCDAQTSGGLLIAVSEEDASRLVLDLERRGTPCAAVIGRVEADAPGTIRVVQ